MHVEALPVESICEDKDSNPAVDLPPKQRKAWQLDGLSKGCHEIFSKTNFLGCGAVRPLSA